jgi:Neurotransmitter-gated ion-channel transmembrane region
VNNTILIAPTIATTTNIFIKSFTSLFLKFVKNYINFLFFLIKKPTNRTKQYSFSGVTILLSLTVFLNLVAESMPTTSDAVPLIGTLHTIAKFAIDLEQCS